VSGMRKIRYSFSFILLMGCVSDPPGMRPPGPGSVVNPPPGMNGGTGGAAPVSPPPAPVNPGTGGGAGGTGGSAGTGGSPPPVKMDAAPTPPPPVAMDAAAPPPAAPDAAAPPNPAPVPWTPRPSPMSVAVYDDNRIVDFYLTFPPGQWEVLLKGGPPEDDSRWARCSFTFEGATIPEARCRRKGDPAGWRDELKPQIIVRFNFDNKQARFRGLRRLNLESYVGTDAPIRDRLGMWVMRESGVDAPRANHARVFKDGQLLGLYQNIEALDKEFLEDHFGPESGGNLWDSGIELKTNEETPDATRLETLKSVVEREPASGDHTQFYKWLPTVLDVDQVVLELAAETALTADDNFGNGAYNFYYYEHPRRGFLVLPWDLDTIYNAEATSDMYGFSDENTPNRLRQLMNQNNDWRARFIDRLVFIRDKVLPRLPAETDRVCNQIAAAYAADPNKHSSPAEFQAECAWFKTRVGERIDALRRMIGR
jgi:hypothetical protein